MRWRSSGARRPLRWAAYFFTLVLVGLDPFDPLAAWASFGSSTPAKMLTVSSLIPAPASSLGVSACGLTVLGFILEEVTLTWTAPSEPDVTGYGVLVNGELQQSILPTNQTSWSEEYVLAIGTKQFQIRTFYGAAQAWYADSTPESITFQLFGTVCSDRAEIG